MSRMPVLCTEDALGTVGMIARMLSKKIMTKQVVYASLQAMTIYPKWKDAGGLLYLGRNEEKYKVSKALRNMVEYKAMQTLTGTFAKAAQVPLKTLMTTCEESAAGDKPLNDYERLAIMFCHDRATTKAYGGYEDDRWVALASALLIARHRMTHIECSVRMKNALRDYRPPHDKYTELPFYVWDKHTRVGKMALAAVAKHKNPLKLEPDKLAQLQFMAESAIVDSKIVSIHTKWWDVFTDAKCKFFFDTDWQGVRTMWRDYYVGPFKAALQWAISKQ